MRKFILLLVCSGLVVAIISGCGGLGNTGNLTYAVSGQITQLVSGQAVDGVTLTFSNGQTIITGPDGTWHMDGLSGSITVTPNKDAWAFDPQNFRLTQAGINANFKGTNASGTTYTASGKISDYNGNGINNVVLTFNSGFGTVTTASDGTWSKDGLWGKVNVTPSKTDWAFSPMNQDLTGPTNNINFSAKPGKSPIAPSNLYTSIVFPDQITLTWTDNSDNEAGFKIEQKTGTSGNYCQIDTVNANIQTYTVNSLTRGTPYYFRVKAFNDFGDSGYTNEVTSTIPTPTPTPIYHFISQWGGAGTGNGKFNHPESVAVDSSGNIYVADFYNYLVQKFTNDGSFLTQWGGKGSGNGKFNGPCGVAVDSTGNIYITDYVNNLIQKLANDGTFLTQWGGYGSGYGKFSSPQSIAVDSAGNVFVADFNNNLIQKFTNDGTFLTQWGGYGYGNGKFHWLSGIAVDSSGNIYVGDFSTCFIQKFTNSGTFVMQWGGYGSGYGKFNNLSGIAVDSAGNVYAVDSGNNFIQKFTSNGTFITLWGGSGSGGIVVDSAGNVFVVANNNLIQKFR